MFTGIVTDVGQVRQIEKRGDTHIVIATHYDMEKLPMGGSVACAGTCLTIVERGPLDDPWFAVTASADVTTSHPSGTPCSTSVAARWAPDWAELFVQNTTR